MFLNLLNHESTFSCVAPLNFGKIFSMSPKAILMWCDASEKSTLKLGACCCGLVTGWENKKVEAVGFNGSG